MDKYRWEDEFKSRMREVGAELCLLANVLNRQGSPDQVRAAADALYDTGRSLIEAHRSLASSLERRQPQGRRSRSV